MKRTILFILCAILLCGCGQAAISEDVSTDTVPVTIPETSVSETTVPAETEPADPIEERMMSMPLTDWVGQIFLVGADPNFAEYHISQYNIGGFLLFSGDFKNETPGTSAAQKIAHWQEAAKIPLLIATDEEGGTVTRISRYAYYRDSKFASPRDLYNRGGMDAVLDEEAEKCQLLSMLGVNVNLGPVCDITTDPNAFMYQRSLGRDAETTAEFVAEMIRLKQKYSIGSSLKHFPGYGNNADTHTGIAIDERSLSQLETGDLLPFLAGMEAGAGAVMVSHTVVTALDADLPASLSPAVVRYLREDMGFQGVIITDDLVMEAITDRYGAGEAAVMAVLAGADLLCSSSFTEQYEAVLAAVLDGRIPYDTLKQAVYNVLKWKYQLGLL